MGLGDFHGGRWKLRLLLSSVELYLFIQWLHEALEMCRHCSFTSVDERQITHLICARLKYDLYDFFRGVLGLLPVLFLV